MAYVLVDDPEWKGKPPIPQILRTWAMRKLSESGMEIGDIARKYEVPYAAAYRAINPVRQMKRRKPAGEDLSTVKTSRLLTIEVSKIRTAADRARIQRVSDELDRRGVTR